MTYGKVHTDGSRSGGQPIEPKLLTEVEARAIYLAATSPDDFNRRLNERGLIASEPVDPLLIEAEGLVEIWSASHETNLAALALAAIRRGMEIARPEVDRWKAAHGSATRLIEEKEATIHQLGENAATAVREYAERVAVLELALQTVVDALRKHHQWHAAQTDPDPEHGFIPANEYAESSLYDLTVEAFWSAQKATGPHDFAALTEPQP